MLKQHVPCTACAALAKYGKGQSTDDLALAVEMLIERNLIPRLPPQAQLVSNAFRTERLYTEEVSAHDSSPVLCMSCVTDLLAKSCNTCAAR